MFLVMHGKPTFLDTVTLQCFYKTKQEFVGYDSDDGKKTRIYGI